ncbi:hypothetical protein [Streptosporangium roseum]
MLSLALTPPGRENREWLPADVVFRQLEHLTGKKVTLQSAA